MTAEEKIINVAFEAFKQAGVKNVTMDSISQAAGVSKRTVYELFKDKDDLAFAVIKYMIIQHNKEMIEIIGHTDNVIEALFILLENESNRRQDLPSVFLNDIQKYLPKINEFMLEHEKLADFSAGYLFLTKGIEQGVLLNNLRTDIVDVFLHEMITMLHKSERLKAFGMNKTEVLDNIIIPYVRGLCTSKGLDLMNKFFTNKHIEF